MKAKQLATGMLVAVLLLSGLVMLPGTTVQAASSAPISLNVVDSTNAPISGATATLTETHTSKMYSTTSDAGGLATFSPLPGYYILRISKSGYYDLEYATVVKYDGINSYNVGLVQISKQPVTTGTITVTVNSGLSVTLKTIDLSSPTRMEKSYTFTTTTILTVYTSGYRLVTSANGYETDVRDVTVTSGGNVNVNINLNTAVKLSGYVYKAGVPPSGMTAVLVSSNLALQVEKRIITARVTSNYFEFDAFADSNAFYLMVDATDSQASMQSIILVSSQSVTVNLVAQGTQVDSNGVVFASNDWNNFNLYRNITMDFDMAWANIAYSNLPNLRMQIDFAFGDGNGMVSATEYNAFLNKVRAYGPVNVTSDFLVKVNSTKYTVLTDFTASAFTGLSGIAVTSTTPFSGAFVTAYRSQSTIVNDGSTYTVVGYAKYDTNSLDYKVFLTWPRGNEMTANSTSTGNAVVTGYLTVVIDPVVRSTGTHELVTMTIQKSVAPSATGGVDVPSDYAYAVTSGTSVLHYIVNSQKAIVFTANGSSDPNGNPLKFSWNFGNGVTKNLISSYWTTNTYNAAAFNLTVTLTVTDVAGLTAVKTFWVKSDGLNPVPGFTVLNHTYSSSAPNWVVKQNEALVFNGAASVDHIASLGDTGIIKKWEYIWGDGNKTTVGIGENQNVTKTYARAGTFTLLLNTTDVAGRVTTNSTVIYVKDTVAPVVSFTVYLNGVDVKGTAQENKTLVFSGNATHDANDSFDQLTFAWTYGDGSTNNTAWGTHRYQNIKSFTVKLEVTDKAGNKANVTKSLVITSQPRPDLRIVSVIASPNPMTEGETGVFKVNITNVGNYNATTPEVTVYRLSSDGKTRIKIGSSTAMRVNGSISQILPIGYYGVLEISWTPEAKGNYTIVTEASVNDEVIRTDNTHTSAITVNEATWKAVALYGGIFAVIIVVIVLYYYRRRLPKLGGRKEKASKEEPRKQAEEKERKSKK